MPLHSFLPLQSWALPALSMAMPCFLAAAFKSFLDILHPPMPLHSFMPLHSCWAGAAMADESPAAGLLMAGPDLAAAAFSSARAAWDRKPAARPTRASWARVCEVFMGFLSRGGRVVSA